jgi:hypothetical protein
MAGQKLIGKLRLARNRNTWGVGGHASKALEINCQWLRVGSECDVKEDERPPKDTTN